MGEGAAVADVWLLKRKHSAGDERMWKRTHGVMPAGLDSVCTVFRGSLSSYARWVGDERGHGWGGGGGGRGRWWVDTGPGSNSAEPLEAGAACGSVMSVTEPLTRRF